LRDTVDRPLRLLIVDDSAYNRRLLQGLFTNRPEVEVVGVAGDGEEALRLVNSLEPDAMTLDLEMPKMDGFTLLRIVLARRQIPIIVVSSYAQNENVFRALELGAVDFVTKASSTIDANAEELKQEIVAKVLAVRSAKLRPDAGRISQRKLPDVESSGSIPSLAPAQSGSGIAPQKVVVIASSTGGPAALLELVAAVSAGYPHTFLIAQHMPEKFTRTFAERLGKRGLLQGAEAMDGEPLSAGTVRVCPGGYVMEIEKGVPGMPGPRGSAKLRVQRPHADDRYVPSGDRLFLSAARTFGRNAVAVVLTGMGDDGLAGARLVRAAGGTVIAEAEETAVVFGMPGAIVRAGLATETLPIGALAQYLAKLT
jgi:two-component system, chemotaxis family, protein-glutamate methylesterase/glutaminase